MDSIPHYLACREGRESPQYEVPALAEILGDTEGCIVYQEQVMQIFRTLAGYSFARADLVRRAMAKKKGKILDAELEGFLAGTAERGIPEAAARSIFDRMHRFAEYAFNKSHAAAYATLSFRTAYLRAHYPREYLAALLTSVLGDQTKTAQYVAEAARAGIAVLPPDINVSGKTFTVDGKGIRFGLLALRNVGTPFVEAILEERRHAPFRSFQDFVERMSGRDANRRQVESLIKSGAFDRLGVFRSRLLASYETILDETADRNRAGVTGQLDIFTIAGGTDAVTNSEFSYPEIPELGLRELLTLEKESTGMYFSGHVIDEYQAHIERHGCTPISEILDAFSDGEEGNERFSDGMRITVGGILTRRVNKSLKNGSSMAVVTLEDRYGEIDAVAFEKTLERYGGELRPDSPVAITGKISAKEGQKPEVLIYSVSPLVKEERRAGCAEDGGRRLFLRVRSLEDDTCRSALHMLERYPGKTEVVMYDSSAEKYVTVSRIRVNAEGELRDMLIRLLGSQNVIYR